MWCIVIKQDDESRSWKKNPPHYIMQCISTTNLDRYVLLLTTPPNKHSAYINCIRIVLPSFVDVCNIEEFKTKHVLRLAKWFFFFFSRSPHTDINCWYYIYDTFLFVLLLFSPSRIMRSSTTKILGWAGRINGYNKWEK